MIFYAIGATNHEPRYEGSKRAAEKVARAMAQTGNSATIDRCTTPEGWSVRQLFLDAANGIGFIGTRTWVLEYTPVRVLPKKDPDDPYEPARYAVRRKELPEPVLLYRNDGGSIR